MCESLSLSVVKYECCVEVVRGIVNLNEDKGVKMLSEGGRPNLNWSSSAWLGINLRTMGRDCTKAWLVTCWFVAAIASTCR